MFKWRGFGEWLVIIIADKLVLEANIGSTNKLGLKKYWLQIGDECVCYVMLFWGGRAEKGSKKISYLLIIQQVDGGRLEKKKKIIKKNK